MRKVFTLLWLLCPVAAVYYHYTAGPDQIARVQARQHAATIRAAEQVKEPDWATIIEEYDKLDAELPGSIDERTRHQIRLAKAKARLEMLDVAGATEELTQLLQESAVQHGEEAPITRATRETLGKAHCYAVFLLKNSGAPETEWRPYAERTRQIFRFLAEHEDPGALAAYESRVAAEFQKTIAP